VTPPPIEVRTLGTISTSRGNLARRRKPLVLLTYLVLGGRREYQQRDVLTALFWPDSPDRLARASLRQALATIERELGPVLERRGTEEIRAGRDRVRVDVEDFLECLGREEWTKALRLYRGPFLDGVHLPGAPEVERWIDLQQLRLAEGYRSALTSVADSTGDRPVMHGTQLWSELARRAPTDAASANMLADLATPHQTPPTRPARARGIPGCPPVARHRSSIAAAAAAAALSGLLAAAIIASSSGGSADRPIRVAVPEVAVPVGSDAGLDESLSLVLGEEIGRIASIERLGPGPPMTTEPDRPSLEWAADLGIDVLVLGRLQNHPRDRRLIVAVLDVASRQPVRAALSATVPEDGSAHEAMRELGERVATVVASRYAPPHSIRGDHSTRADVPRFPAYLEFSRALAAFERRDYSAAAWHARTAQTLEPGYVSARIELAIQYANLGAYVEASEALDSARTAYPQLGEWDRGRYEWLDAVLTGDRAKRVRASLKAETLMTPYQRAYELSNVGQLRAALSILEGPTLSEPARPSAAEFWLKGVNLHRLGRHVDEGREARRYRQAYPDSDQPIRLAARASAATGDTAAVRRLMLAAARPSRPYGDAHVAHEAAMELLAHQHDQADRWLEIALDRYGTSELSGPVAADRVRLRLALGHWAEARADLDTMRGDGMTPLEYRGSMAVVDARTNRRAEARAAAIELREGHPANAGERKLWEARIAAALGEGSRVPGLLREATRLGAARPAWVHAFPEWRFLEDRSALEAWLAPS
jgi:tetratricopeptide (TPR) repeat protein